MPNADPLDSELVPAALRDALRMSPDNAPLLEHVAESVLKLGGFPEAESLFKRALALNSESLTAKLGLAAAFFHAGKPSAALVIVESLTKQPDSPVRALVLHARLALKAGEPQFAASLYERALHTDPRVKDPALDESLAKFLTKSTTDVPAPASTQPPRSEGFEPPLEPEDSPERFGKQDENHPTALPDGDLPDDPEAEVEKPSINFEDVGGMDPLKEEIRMKIILPLTSPDLFKAYGKKAGGGILLYGPPGCGKTYLARATAGQVNAAFMAIGISDVLDMWIGQSEKNLHAIFEQARSHKPCVLFFDEVDALGANRTHMLRSGGRHLINQFLSELDGVTSTNDDLLILAATNAPWHLDSAFRRPGRFDRILFVPPPDAKARAAILRLQLRGKPIGAIDFDSVAKKTAEFSGADLRAVIELAVEAKLRDAMKSGQVSPVETRDLLAAAKRLKPTTGDWFETARNHALYSNQSGLYDDILTYLKIKK